MNVFEMKYLRSRLMKSTQTISSLVAKTGGFEELMKFFNWMYEQPEMKYPQLLQGDDIEDNGPHEYQGQPVVWDGDFSLVDGELIYSGYAGASGLGGAVQRVVKITDQVMTG